MRTVATKSYMVWQGAYGTPAKNAAEAAAGYIWLSGHRTEGGELRAVEYTSTTYAAWTRDRDGRLAPATVARSAIHGGHPKNGAEITVWLGGHGYHFPTVKAALVWARAVARGEVHPTFLERPVRFDSIEVVRVVPRDLAGPRAASKALAG